METGEFFERIIGNDVEAVAAALRDAPALAGARDGYLGSTPLHFASHRGFTEIVEALLAAGADVHAREAASETTPLHWAAEGGHPVVARRLVERGADLEPLDSWHRLAPLGWATVVDWAPQFREDRPATVACLRQAGARLDVFTAMVLGDAAAIRALAAADPSALERRLGFLDTEMTPLHFAVTRRDPEMAALLLDLGCGIEARTASGLSVLALALQGGDGPMPELLRRRGAVEDASSALCAGDLEAMAAHLGRSSGDAGGPARNTRLLFVAAQCGLAGAIVLLLRHGADPEGRERHLVGEVPAMVAPLHLAALGGHEAAARALLDAGAAPGPGADEGTPTPLHLAAGGGHLEPVRLLIDRGAAVSVREKGFGATAADWAEHEDQPAIAALLRAREKPPSA